MNIISYRNTTLKISVIAILLLFLFKINNTVLYYLNVIPGVSLLFLPAFLKIAAVTVFRWQGVIGIFLGFCLITNYDRTLEILLLDAFIFCIGPMLALLITQLTFRIPNTLLGLRPHHVVSISLLAASIQSIYFFNVFDDTSYIFSAWIGDMAGSMLTLGLLSISICAWGRFTKLT